MIECIAGLLAGWLAGRYIPLGSGAVNGMVSLLIFLIAADELAAYFIDPGRRMIAGLARKAVFCCLAFIFERHTGAPATVVAALFLTGSLFLNLAVRTRKSETAG